MAYITNSNLYYQRYNTLRILDAEANTIVLLIFLSKYS